MNGGRRVLERQGGLIVAARFVARYEGGQSPDRKFRAYWDPHGRVWTQGYGHTVGVTEHSPPWPKHKALRVLVHDLARVYGAALDNLELPLKRNMYAASVSFIFNTGVGMLEPSHDFGRELRAHRWQKAADFLPEYNRSATGEVLQGLVTRRAAERALFLKDL